MSMDNAKMIEKKSIFVNETLRTNVDCLLMKIMMICLPLLFNFFVYNLTNCD